MKSLLLIPVTAIGLFAAQAPASALDVNTEFPVAETGRSWGAGAPASRTYYGFDEADDEPEAQPSPTSPSGYKYTANRACDWNSKTIGFFGACTGDGDKTPAKLRVTPETESKSYGLARFNMKREPTIQDWNDAFASGE
jgi:hypothetical protein